VVKVKGLNDFFVTFFTDFGTQNACTSFPFSQGDKKGRPFACLTPLISSWCKDDSVGTRHAACPELVSGTCFSISRRMLLALTLCLESFLSFVAFLLPVRLRNKKRGAKSAPRIMANPGLFHLFLILL
jgi:hypothetical protein